MNFHQPPDDDFDMFDVARSRMETKHQNAGHILDRVNQVYVSTGRDDVLRNSFDRFLTFVTARQRHGRRGKGNAYFITGESGAGKSDIVENLLIHHPVMQPVTYRAKLIKPWITVSLQGPATLRVLGAEILRAIDYSIKQSAKQAEIWRILPEQLKDAKVFLVHIDETQHLLTKGADTEAVTSAIKGLMNNAPWPVSFILSGKPRLNDLIVHDDQAERRSFSLPLGKLNTPDDIGRIVKIIEEHCKAAGLSFAEVVKEDMPERIAHAANHEFGRICEVVIAAIHCAVLMSSAELTRNHFNRAYWDHSHTRGNDDFNPFFVEDWNTLKPGYFVLRRENDGTEE